MATTKKTAIRAVQKPRGKAQKRPTIKRDAPTLQTRIIFILDESGSMAHRTPMLIDGVNEYINRLKAENKDYLDMFRLSIYKFDTRYRGIYEELPLRLVEPINLNHYNAAYGGSTALLDAVGRTLTVAGIGPTLKNLVIINTDGFENASHEFTKPRVAQLVREREESGMWTFVYLGAQIDAWAGAQSIGSYTPNNSITYDWSNTNTLYAGLATGTTRMSSSAATASTGFVQDYTDLDVDQLAKPNTTDTAPPTTVINNVIDTTGETEKKRKKQK